MATNDRAFIPTTIAVLTVSNSRTEDNDKSGKLLVDRVTATGHQLHEKRIVRDDIFQIRAAVSAWIAESDVQVVVTTGGTGVTGHDGTPEAVLPLLEKVIDGFGEIFRYLSYDEIGTCGRFERYVYLLSAWFLRRLSVRLGQTAPTSA